MSPASRVFVRDIDGVSAVLVRGTYAAGSVSLTACTDGPGTSVPGTAAPEATITSQAPSSSVDLAALPFGTEAWSVQSLFDGEVAVRHGDDGALTLERGDVVLVLAPEG